MPTTVTSTNGVSLTFRGSDDSPICMLDITGKSYEVTGEREQFDDLLLWCRDAESFTHSELFATMDKIGVRCPKLPTVTTTGDHYTLRCGGKHGRVLWVTSHKALRFATKNAARNAGPGVRVKAADYFSVFWVVMDPSLSEILCEDGTFQPFAYRGHLG